MDEEAGLGDKVKDRVSGLEGIAVSEIKYLNGCRQCGVVAKVKDGKVPGAEYIDVGQLEVVEKGVVICQKPIEEEPGGDQPHAPTK